MKHTPTPWKLIETYGEHCIVRAEMKGGELTSLGDVDAVLATSEWMTLTDADAEFIVRAVNAHDALVSATEALMEHLKTLLPVEGYSGARDYFLESQVLAALTLAKEP